MLDTLHPTARDYLALGTAFAVQTSLRSFCINSPFVFGNDLREVRILRISCNSVRKWLIGMILIAVLAGLLMILEFPMC